MIQYTIEQLCQNLEGILVGNTNTIIVGPEQLEFAKSNQISIIGNKKYIKQWIESKACAAIVNDNLDIEPGDNKAFIKVKNADIAMANLLDLFAEETPFFETNVHKKAVIDATAIIGEGSKIGANCYIGKDVVIGKNAIVYANATIMDSTIIGDNTIIWSGVVIRERTIIGKNCIIHPNASIGADGFGFRPHPEGKGLIKIPHIGNVIIGNDVEIGANSCIDRGKFSATILGDGCKIDNLVQIGHNCRLGACCIMAGNSGLAGSVTLGNGVVIGGGACITDHVTLGNGVQVGGGSGVMGDFEAGKKVLGYPAIESRDALKQWVVLRKLAKES
jgi:UDP-3-O-[3-hydroxymyristoyl] glucosamine N-acyltransferase